MTAKLPFNTGDLVVHATHGVGRFQGVRSLTAEGVTREYLQLDFANGERVFVPIENVEKLVKHVGEEVPLARLTTAEGTPRSPYARPAQPPGGPAAAPGQPPPAPAPPK